ERMPDVGLIESAKVVCGHGMTDHGPSSAPATGCGSRTAGARSLLPPGLQKLPVGVAHSARFRISVVHIKAVAQANRFIRSEDQRLFRQFAVGVGLLAEGADGEQSIIPHVKPRLAEAAG